MLLLFRANIGAEHGHEHCNNIDNYLHVDEHSDKMYREKNDQKLINGHQSFSEYDLALEILNNLSSEELQELLDIHQKIMYTILNKCS